MDSFMDGTTQNVLKSVLERFRGAKGVPKRSEAQPFAYGDGHNEGEREEKGH
jgi:hypothetical protein